MSNELQKMHENYIVSVVIENQSAIENLLKTVEAIFQNQEKEDAGMWAIAVSITLIRYTLLSVEENIRMFPFVLKYDNYKIKSRYWLDRKYSVATDIAKQLVEIAPFKNKSQLLDLSEAISSKMYLEFLKILTNKEIADDLEYAQKIRLSRSAAAYLILKIEHQIDLGDYDVVDSIINPFAKGVFQTFMQ